MAITIYPQDAKNDIWKFFVQWLTLLEGSEPEAAFAFIDGCSPQCEQFDAKSFATFLREFSGQPHEQYEYADLLLEGEKFDDCKEDSSVWQNSNGSWGALLYMPLDSREFSPLSHELVPAFDFIPTAEGEFRVFLHIDDNVLIL
jgi:hypothetical protein